MDLLHATWRIDYVAAPRSWSEGEDKGGGKTSPFAALLASRDDETNLLLWRGPLSFLILNRFPYNAGHLLALPNREVASLAELTREERVDLLDTVMLGQDVLQRGLNPDGFNIGLNLGHAAGAGIPQHLHIHIVPRWAGDTNFMPVIGSTRVLPEALAATWRKLRALLPQAAPAGIAATSSPVAPPARPRTGGTTPPFP